MTLHFFLRYHSHPGQQLWLTGNLEPMGSGRPEQGLQMQYLNEDFWYIRFKLPPNTRRVSYRYALRQEDGTFLPEWREERTLDLTLLDHDHLQLADCWMDNGAVETAFSTQPFRETLLKRLEPNFKKQDQKNPSHIFRAKAPQLAPHETLALIGSTPELGEWRESRAPWMQERNGWFEVQLDLRASPIPTQYKYGVIDTRSGAFLRYEEGANRSLDGFGLSPLTIVHDGYAALPDKGFRAGGVAIPVFSLRSANSFGIGEFADIPALADWCRSVGMKLIQLLPVNDTTGTRTWLDSYPYAPISVFALHPIYINLKAVAAHGKMELPDYYEQHRQRLNSLPVVDYEGVLQEKWALLKLLYEAQKNDWLKDKAYRAFLKAHASWLIPYAAFCHFRDKHGSPEFTQWGEDAKYRKKAIEKMAEPEHEEFDQLGIHLFVQYHLHLQLKAAVDYAHEQQVVLKGDLPIGIYRHSCDAWVAPELYNMNAQAGAPPDDFAVKGQNWGFPTYDWARMKADDFAWWKQRFAQMSHYFDAFRIDHILGFFRIWSIPMHAVEGILGHFVPAMPVTPDELAARNIPVDLGRYARPYITSELLKVLFGNKADWVKGEFLDRLPDGLYCFRKEVDTQRKVEAWFEAHPEVEPELMEGLFDLLSNVILLPDQHEPEAYHFRVMMMDTHSYQQLEPHVKHQLYELYIDYFYRRQDDFWRQEAMEKLPALKTATGMLICGEDLGMVPDCVPGVMRDLGLLSLEIQRMPKDPKTRFFNPATAPYLSVVTPSTHDMSTIRGWWEEDAAQTQLFFNEEMGQPGEAPSNCEPWINRVIVEQHAHSPAMWSIFQIQDLMGIDGSLRREDPQTERINIPANPKHYWRYRMHLSLEDLSEATDFNRTVTELLRASGRG